MSRPRKTETSSYRTPTYHKPTSRWRLRIEHAHGEKSFWWPAEPDTAVCPTDVLAAAFRVQDEWRMICGDWHWIELAMRLDQPDLDWSRPVWVDRAKAQAVVTRCEQEMVQNRVADIKSAVHSIALYGIDEIVAAARQPNLFSYQFTPDQVK